MATAKDRLRSALSGTTRNTGLDLRKGKYVSVKVKDLVEVASKTPNHPQARVYLQALKNVNKEGYNGTVKVDAVDLQALLEGRESVEIFELGERVVRTKVLN